jgi:hypothetical protein
MQTHEWGAGEELEMYEEWLDSEESQIADVDALLREEALSKHLTRLECFAGGYEIDDSLDVFY